MKIVTALAVIALFLSGCAKKNDTTDAVKQGVIRDLGAKFDMQKMDVIVDAVSFRDKEADASVTFAVKGMPADQGGAMHMKYVMERHDDGQWHIKSRAAADTGGAPGATGAAPAGHPGMEGMDGGALPPGHPPTGQTK